jgi:hypothetical protein
VWAKTIISRFRSSLGSGSESGASSSLKMAKLTNLCGGMTVTFLLSCSPRSAFGGCDRVSAGVLAFPGICLIS